MQVTPSGPGRWVLGFPAPSAGCAPRDQCLFWGMLFPGYKWAVTVLVPSHSGPIHPQSGNQVSVTLERCMGRESWGCCWSPLRGPTGMRPEEGSLGETSGWVLRPPLGQARGCSGKASCSPWFLSLPVTSLALRKTSVCHRWRQMMVRLHQGRGVVSPSLASICLLPSVC